MLTKDLLKFTRREDRVFPKYIKPADPDLLQIADSLVRLFTASIGSSWKDLNEQIKAQKDSSSNVFQGFCKLLEDRCTFNDSQDLQQNRWQWFECSRQIRASRVSCRSDFEVLMQQSAGVPFAELQERIYADLPEHRTVRSFAELSADALLHRYNAAQIQGLLLRAQELRFIIKEKDVLLRRRLLQKLRFCRLMAEFEDNSTDDLILKISGPLAIFDQAQSYGMRLCQFFPYVLLLQHWEMEALVKLGETSYQLKVDSSRPISSHYRSFTGYIPEEFQQFISAFNELDCLDRKGWLAEEGREHINLGMQNYSFPDLTLRHKNGMVAHLELFHRWHGSELRRRIKTMQEAGKLALILGASQDLMKDESLEGLLAQAKETGISIFTFRQFPKVKAILTYLPKVNNQAAVL